LYELRFSQFYVWKSSVGYYGNKGQSKANFDNTVELPDPENPHLGANIFLLSLKMAELLPFKVAIGRNANFQILGEKGGSNVKIHHRDPQKALPCAKTRRLTYRSWKSVNYGDL